MRRSRVLVAAAGLLFAILALWLRVGWLQIAQHEHYVRRAEANQEKRVLRRPVRGALLDRHGQPLAHDLRTYSIAVTPREMKDPAGVARELARLLGRDPKRLRREFQARPRYLEVGRRVAPEIGQRIADRNWRGVYLTVETERHYALGNAALEVLGRTDRDNSGVDGLELQLDETLRGQPGWSTLHVDGRGRTRALPRGLKRDPTHGQHVVLTIDAELQSILESHLARAVDTLEAKRGFALFLDPATGEILAAANVPHLGPGKAKNWTITDQYEPGSTFKIVVAGAALEENLARPNQWFEAAESGRAQIVPGCVFTDTHEAARFTFFQAVQYSSNIVLGRLGASLGAERLYRYVTAFGFGSLTGVEFPGEASGHLRDPSRWSGRSAPTISIGYEVSVTPLQLALAYAAVANGGVLMQPMLVREIRDETGHTVRRFTPQASHRVFSEATTRTLRTMLTAVVDSGTATAARVRGMAIAGKTGTARKLDSVTKRYGPGMYIASFVGFVPAEQPRLVGVVVVDEPKGSKYYGGQIAAPVFREVLLDLRRLPDSPLDPGVTTIAARPPAPAPVLVPDLHLLPPRAAEQRLARFGLRAHFKGRGARVLAQTPAAGVASERGASIALWLEPPQDSIGRMLPDLAGLSVREALRCLGRQQLSARIVGSGHVVRQHPEAGTPLPIRVPIRLWCEPGVRLEPVADGAPLAPADARIGP